MIKVSPSILAADFTRLGEDIRSVEAAEYLHFDVMDGVFVPNISVGLPVLECVRKATSMTLDVHLMIERPIKYVESFAKAGADIIVFHVEADTPHNILEAIKIVKSLNKKVGLSLKPKTPADSLAPYLKMLDMILVMTVEPGFGGQSFMYDQLEKITQIRKMIDDAGGECDIEVDGGINAETAKQCVSAGANVLVAGSYIFKAADRTAVIKGLRG